MWLLLSVRLSRCRLVLRRQMMWSLLTVGVWILKLMRWASVCVPFAVLTVIRPKVLLMLDSVMSLFGYGTGCDRPVLRLGVIWAVLGLLVC